MWQECSQLLLESSQIWLDSGHFWVESSQIFWLDFSKILFDYIYCSRWKVTTF